MIHLPALQRLFDSGAIEHMTGMRSQFYPYKPSSHKSVRITMGPHLKLCEKVQLMLVFSFLTHCFFTFLNLLSILFQSVAWLNSQFLFYSILLCVFHNFRTRWKIGGGCESNGLYLLQLAKENPVELSAINCQGGHYTMALKT